MADRSDIHPARLAGPAVGEGSGVAETRTSATFEPGSYRHQREPHASSVRGDLEGEGDGLGPASAQAAGATSSGRGSTVPFAMRQAASSSVRTV